MTWNDSEDVLDVETAAEFDAEFDEAVSALEDFRRRHRRGRALNLVNDVFAAIRDLRVLADKHLTPGQQHALWWLIIHIADSGGALSIDFDELAGEVQISRATLARYAADFKSWAVLNVEPQAGAAKFGLHRFSFTESTARAVLS